jgi:protein O-mannosyl-transferase
MQLKLSTSRISEKNLHYLILSCILILTIIIYSSSFRNDFTNLDDSVKITDNKDIQNFSVPGIIKIFSSFYITTYQPLPFLIFSIIYKIFGLNPTAYHSVNILFHLLNIILVYLFIFKLTGLKSKDYSSQSSKYRIQIASLVALLFSIHPMNTESICWIGGLDNSMYSFFYLGSIVSYLKYMQGLTFNGLQSMEISRNSMPKYRYYLISLFLFIFSLLSKPMSVTLPVILILIDYYINTSKFKVQSLKYWLDKIPFIILAIVFGIINLISEKATGSNRSNNVIPEYSLFNRIFILTYSVSFYIIKLIAPLKLSALHPSPETIKGLLPVKYYLSPIIIFLIVIFLKIKREKLKAINKEVLFGIFFFLFAMSVALIAGKVRYIQVAERYTYIPYLGLFFIIAIFLGHESIGSYQQKKSKIQKIKALIIVFFIISFSIISYNRNKVWANSIVLFSDLLEKYPRSYLAYEFRGDAKSDLGDKLGAILDYNKVIEINPQFSEAFVQRGNARNAINDKLGAIEDYNKVIEITPQYAKTYYNRGNVKASMGDMQGAILDFNRTIEINPKDAEAYNNRGNAKASMGDLQGAIIDFNRAIDYNPKNAQSFNNRGSAKYLIGNKAGACEDWRISGELGSQQAYNLIKRYCR